MRRVWGAILSLLLAGAYLAAPGCTGDAEPDAAAPALVSEVESGPVQLSVSSSDASMRTVDRVEVRIQACLDTGAALTELGLDAESEGWTVISDRLLVAQSLPDGRVLHERTLVLEPFLEGEYTIPSARAAWTRGEESGVMLSDPMTISVQSVLKEDDTLELSGRRELPPESEPDEAGVNGTLIWIATRFGWVGVLAIGLVVWLLIRRNKRDPVQAILARLERVASEPSEVSSACAEAAIALRTLSSDHPPEATRALIDRLDDARFEPHPGASNNARRLITDAIEHCRTLLDQREARA